MPATVCAPSLRRVSAPRLAVAAFDAQSASRSRPHSAAELCPRVPSPYCPLLPPSIYWHLLQQKSCLKHRKPSFCHARRRAGQGAHQCRPLSASVCSLNRKISRKVPKVGTLDEKGIYRISEKLIQAISGILCVPWLLKCWGILT